MKRNHSFHHTALLVSGVLGLSMLLSVTGCITAHAGVRSSGLPAASSQTSAATPFAQHGRLQVRGIELVDQSGAPFQLKGVSTHGLQWFPQYVSQESFASLQSWGANAVRLAMYTGEGGYVSGGDRAQLEATIDRGVQAAAALGMYDHRLAHPVGWKSESAYGRGRGFLQPNGREIRRSRQCAV